MPWLLAMARLGGGGGGCLLIFSPILSLVSLLLQILREKYSLLLLRLCLFFWPGSMKEVHIKYSKEEKGKGTRSASKREAKAHIKEVEEE